MTVKQSYKTGTIVKKIKNSRMDLQVIYFCAHFRGMHLHVFVKKNNNDNICYKCSYCSYMNEIKIFTPNIISNKQKRLLMDEV